MSLPELSYLSIKSVVLHRLTVLSPSFIRRLGIRGWAFSVWQERKGFKFDRDSYMKKEASPPFKC